MKNSVISNFDTVHRKNVGFMKKWPNIKSLNIMRRNEHDKISSVLNL